MRVPYGDAERGRASAKRHVGENRRRRAAGAHRSTALEPGDSLLVGILEVSVDLRILMVDVCWCAGPFVRVESAERAVTLREGQRHSRPLGKVPEARDACAGHHPTELSRSMADTVVAVTDEVLRRQLPVGRRNPLMNPLERHPRTRLPVGAVEDDVEEHLHVAHVLVPLRGILSQQAQTEPL